MCSNKPIQPLDRDTYTMNSTYVVMDRLKLITKVTTLRELSAKLKISYDILRNRCGRDSMPYKEVVTFCYEKDIDVNDLLFNWVDIDATVLSINTRTYKGGIKMKKTYLMA